MIIDENIIIFAEEVVLAASVAAGVSSFLVLLVSVQTPPSPSQALQDQAFVSAP